MAAIGGIIAAPATLATFVFGLVVMGTYKQYRWIVALCIAGALSFVGLLVMAGVLLSGNSPVAFATPFVLVALVAFAYSLRSGSASLAASA